MSDTVTRREDDPPDQPPADNRDASTGSLDTPSFGRRIGPVLATAAAVLVAGAIGWAAWEAYVGRPWTRDGRVRAYVVTMAPEVSGRIVELPVADNQFVHKGDTLMVVDPKDYAIAVDIAQGQVDQAKADLENKDVLAERRQALTTLSTSVEQMEDYTTAALMSAGAYQQAVAQLARAKVNLERTRIRSPVNGWVTNLQAQMGDYADVGQRNVSVVNADSFWLDAYFEETYLPAIHEGDPVEVKLMGATQILHGHVQGVARGIKVDNAQADAAGLADVNPVFTWVRLAQRIPVRVQLDDVPANVRLVVGQTATIQVNPSH